MKKVIIIIGIALAAIAGIVLLKNSPATSSIIWSLSNQGTWLLPLVLISSLMDSVHPCSFSILLITIAFLFGIQVSRAKILQLGGTYVLGIFTAYFLIGLGMLKVLHLFDTPHFMGKLGATVLILFGVLNLINRFFPQFPIKLKIPQVAHGAMSKLMDKASFPAVFALGLLVGICQFPCMGGPYLMVIGLLHDQVTYTKGFSYLLLYNLILIIPLVVVLFIAAQKALVEKVQIWKRDNMNGLRFWAGIIMILVGFLVLFL
jgi:cytochrome c biogenesis protein CcdA